MNPVLRVIAGIAVFAALVGIYLLTYFLNKKTKKPEGCEIVSENCHSCQVTSCGHNPLEGEKE